MEPTRTDSTEAARGRERRECAEESDALVLFGITGDLAYKKIFPALHAMARRRRLNVPVVGVARSEWSLAQLRERAREGIERHGRSDPAAFERLIARLRYIPGDYAAPKTFAALRRELGAAKHPHYDLANAQSLVATA